jgi:hypothetical protein
MRFVDETPRLDISRKKPGNQLPRIGVSPMSLSVLIAKLS